MKSIKGRAAATNDLRQTQSIKSTLTTTFLSRLFHHRYSFIKLSLLDMSLTFFTEPFYSLSDFDRLFDEAFNARTSGTPSAVARPQSHENAASRPLRPRWVPCGPFLHQSPY